MLENMLLQKASSDTKVKKTVTVTIHKVKKLELERCADIPVLMYAKNIESVLGGVEG